MYHQSTNGIPWSSIAEVKIKIVLQQLLLLARKEQEEDVQLAESSGAGPSWPAGPLKMGNIIKLLSYT
jgi:hypothetical protein